MIYEKILDYLKKCESENTMPDMDGEAQLRLLKAFRSTVTANGRLRGLQLEREHWRAGVHKRCNREHLQWRQRKQIPIVCVCGSTRFKPEWEAVILRETLAGRVVLSVGGFTHHDGINLTDGQKIELDLLHKHKIDIADEILVINQNDYIGESTLSEIRHAQMRGKPIRFHYPLSDEWREKLGIPA